MSSRWDRATIDSMNEDALYTLPDPRFTEGAEGYDPVEGSKDPNKDDFTFK